MFLKGSIYKLLALSDYLLQRAGLLYLLSLGDTQNVVLAALAHHGQEANPGG